MYNTNVRVQTTVGMFQQERLQNERSCFCSFDKF